MGYFNFYIIKKLINSLFSYIRKNKKFIIIFIIFVCILFIKEKCFAVTTNVDTANFDIMNQFIDINDSALIQFVSHSYPPFLGNTEYWEECIKPILDEIKGGKSCVNMTYSINSSRIAFDIYLFKAGDHYLRNVIHDYNSYKEISPDGNSYNINSYEFAENQYVHYILRWFPATNDGTLTLQTNTGHLFVPSFLVYHQNVVFTDFINVVYNGQDPVIVLNDISNYLDDINTVNEDILTMLNTLSSSLSQISTNTSTNYSQQIGQISNKISDILSDNDTIIQQNADMLSQQEEINDNLEDVNDSVQELKDTITDDTVESTASDLPTTDVNNPTETGIDNIFTSIYNAFCVGQAQDIVFPIPFTNKNITLSPYYVQDMLNNNNAGWVYTLIQAFWGYLIGRFIVSDISKKIDKIKSGDIENVQNTNIKEEML